MFKKILLIIAIIVEISAYIYHYSLLIKPKIKEDIHKLLSLNNILANKNNINPNHLRIYKYHNAICYKYNTYSNMNDYKYNNLYLIKNNHTFLINFKFILNDIINDEFNYLILIKFNNNIIDIFIKYKNNNICDNIILSMILGNLYKHY